MRSEQLHALYVFHLKIVLVNTVIVHRKCLVLPVLTPKSQYSFYCIALWEHPTQSWQWMCIDAKKILRLRINFELEVHFRQIQFCKIMTSVGNGKDVTSQMKWMLIIFERCFHACWKIHTDPNGTIGFPNDHERALKTSMLPVEEQHFLLVVLILCPQLR